MSDNKKSSIAKTSSCHLLNVKQPDRAFKRLKLSFRRTTASMNILRVNRKVEVSLGLIDVSQEGAGVFVGEMITKGTAVELCVTDPYLLKVKAIVAWCVPIQSRVASGKYSFRAGMQFQVENEMQKTAIKEFMEKVASGARVSDAPPADLSGPHIHPENANPLPADPAALLATPEAPVVAPVAAEGAAAPAAEATPAAAPSEATAPAAAPVAETPDAGSDPGSKAA